MFNKTAEFFRFLNKKIDGFNKGETVMVNKATIGSVGNRAGLFDRSGVLVKTYARARDARRGASRLGYVVV